MERAALRINPLVASKDKQQCSSTIILTAALFSVVKNTTTISLFIFYINQQNGSPVESDYLFVDTAVTAGLITINIVQGGGLKVFHY